MAEEKTVDPPHLILKKYGLESANCQAALMKLIADKEAAEERARGMEQIIIRAQTQPILVQSAGVRVDQGGSSMKLYAVYNIMTPQDGGTKTTIQVRLIENTEWFRRMHSGEAHPNEKTLDVVMMVLDGSVEWVCNVTCDLEPDRVT